MGLGLRKVFHPLVQNILLPSNTGVPEELLGVYSFHFIIKVVYVLVFEFTSEFYNILVGESPLLGHIVMECYIGYVDASLDFHQPANSSILIIHIKRNAVSWSSSAAVASHERSQMWFWQTSHFVFDRALNAILGLCIIIKSEVKFVEKLKSNRYFSLLWHAYCMNIHIHEILYIHEKKRSRLRTLDGFGDRMATIIEKFLLS